LKQEIYHPRKLIISRFISSLIYPFVRIFIHNPITSDFKKDEIKKILVTEYHCIGDVLMIIPALRLIKSSFPKAELTLLTNSDASALAEVLEIADKIISFDFPWTGKTDKIKYREAWDVAIKLKKENFDLGIDFKGDLRNLIFLWKTGSKFRIGFNGTGGNYFITHPFPFPFTVHQRDRSIQLLRSIGLNKKIDKSIIDIPNSTSDKKDFIVLHPGANHKARQWSKNNWIKLVELLEHSHKIALVKTNDSVKTITYLSEIYPDIFIFSDSLPNFGRWLQHQKMLIGMDSMAVHLAGVLGIPSLAIFGKQDPDLTKPKFNNSEFIIPENSCNHKNNHWRLCGKCTNSVKPEAVFEKIKRLQL
tara:strand:+ start:133 stop:1215 length:1083 start_codon:yes stop_codon:yes gene_type:complete